jgi:NADH-quinone oxidoreductase subunit N
VLGALASGILLYGISLLYGFTGTMSFAGLAAAFGRGAPTIGLLFGLVFLLSGIAFKISAVPFHMWTPDVYEGAPTPVTAFFASAPKVAAVLLATRTCLEALGPATDAWRQIVIFAALASIFLGAVAAYGQTNIKRLLAYSSINNVGFALIGLAAAGPKGAASVLFYMAVYVVMTLGAFLCVLRMRGADGEPLESVDSLTGLSQARPAFAAAIAVFMFSLAGIPPLFGFWPKLLVFNAAVDSGLVALAVAGIVGTVVGAYYYLRIVKIMYFDEAPSPIVHRRQPVEGLLILIAALLVSPLGYLLIGPLGRLADRAAGSIF